MVVRAESLDVGVNIKPVYTGLIPVDSNSGKKKLHSKVCSLASINSLYQETIFQKYYPGKAT